MRSFVALHTPYLIVRQAGVFEQPAGFGRVIVTDRTPAVQAIAPRARRPAKVAPSRGDIWIFPTDRVEAAFSHDQSTMERVIDGLGGAPADKILEGFWVEILEFKEGFTEGDRIGGKQISAAGL